MAKLSVEMRKFWMENVILSEGWRQEMENGDTGATQILIKTVLIFKMDGLSKLVLSMVVFIKISAELSQLQIEGLVQHYYIYIRTDQVQIA